VRGKGERASEDEVVAQDEPAGGFGAALEPVVALSDASSPAWVPPVVEAGEAVPDPAVAAALACRRASGCMSLRNGSVLQGGDGVSAAPDEVHEKRGARGRRTG